MSITFTVSVENGNLRSQDMEYSRRTKVKYVIHDLLTIWKLEKSSDWVLQSEEGHILDNEKIVGYAILPQEMLLLRRENTEDTNAKERSKRRFKY